MKVNGEAVYGTRSSPLPLRPGEHCTRKESRNGTVLYRSVFDWPANGKLTVPDVEGKVKTRACWP